MNFPLTISLLIAIFAYFLMLFYLLKKKLLNLKYTLLWFMSGIVMLVAIIFPQVTKWFFNLFGIEYMLNGLFALMIFCILLILMSLTAIVSKMQNRIFKLAQTEAILEKRIRDLEADKIEIKS